ncbi:MAG: aminoglycoside phosphotransferase family protein [Marinovum sp.]|nr:aminoglycoside phosphotransferase family protein [Marinovum sp.]
MTRPDPTCLAAWPILAKEIGRSVGGAPIVLNAAGTVLRFGDVVLKRSEIGFNTSLRAHRQAARMMRDDNTNRAPKVLAWSENHQVIALDYVAGRTLRDALMDGEDAMHAMTRVAAWLGAFHRLRETRLECFDTRGPLARVPLTAEFLPEHYALAREICARLAAEVTNVPVPKAVLHGDLNAGNLIMTTTTVTGLDFENLGIHPAFRDAGQILSEIRLLSRASERGIWPDAYRLAFKAAYGGSNEALDFFVHQRLLQHWAAIPACAFNRGPRRQRMAQSIEAILGLMGPC